MEKTLISLIENDNSDAFCEKVFKNSIVGGSGGFYVIPLSEKEEKTLVYRVSTEQKDAKWYKMLRDYMSHYTLCNQTLRFLITDINNAMAVKIICTNFKSNGYNPKLAEEMCRIIKKEKCDKMYYPLLSSIAKYGHTFSDSLHFILVSIGDTIREQTSVNPEYAERYKKSVYEYRKQNGLLNFNG